MLRQRGRVPGRPNRAELRRSRLLRRLYRRWDHRVTVVVGGAGFGKTTLLAQALDENRLEPRGDDLWLGCGIGDAEMLVLARDVATVLGIDLPVTSGPAATDTSVLVTVLAHAIWRQAPRHVCLTIDELHYIPADSSGARLLAALVDALPANGHLVLVSRHDPPLQLAHLDVHGHVLRIGEEDLAFDPDELAGFASLRQVPPERLDGVGGWPALAELRAMGHPGRVDDFLSEEVLRGLTADQRRTLTIAAVIGGCDRELFGRVTGQDVDLAALLDDVPLVSCDEDGWFTIHPIWSTQLANQMGPDERNRVQRAAGMAMLARDCYRAMDLLLAAGDEADIEEGLRRSCHAHRLPVSLEGLERVTARLPPTVRPKGIGQLLVGMTTAAHDLSAGVSHLERAVEQCRRDGDEIGMLLALEHLSIHYHWLEDADRLQGLWARTIGELPPESRGLAAIADALVADTRGDAAGVLQAIRALEAGPVDPYWSVPIAWLRATALVALGFPEAARRHVEVALEGTGALLQGAMSMRLVDVLFLTGEHDRAFDTLGRMIDQREEMGNAQTCCLGHCQAATLYALVGHVEVAGQHAHRASLYAGPAPNAPAAAAVLAAHGVVALAAGDEDEAARLLREQRQGRPIGEGRQRYGQLRRLPLHYVLEPGTRDHWDGADVGPCYALARDLARAVTALREDGNVDPAAGLGAEHWATARAFLPVGWQAELAVAAAAGGDADGQGIAQELGPTTRPTLRRLARSRPGVGNGIRRWALTLLDVPALPDAPLQVDVLGPIRLRRDGYTIDHPHWRRQRVRALLLFLLARRGGAREEIAASLWPDLDPQAAARNLRVTLSYLLTVLEPQRPEGEPSCFLRTEATSIRLINDDWLSVDAWEMDRLIDRAHDAQRAGEPSATLRDLRQAVDLYRGPYLADAGYEAWALPHRDRLRARFVEAAVRAGELTLAAGEPDEALRLASRALEEEPYAEAAHRLAVAAHLAYGDLAAAHRALSTCKGQLDELGLGPSEDLEILERSLHARAAAR